MSHSLTIYLLSWQTWSAVGSVLSEANVLFGLATDVNQKPDFGFRNEIQKSSTNEIRIYFFVVYVKEIT